MSKSTTDVLARTFVDYLNEAISEAKNSRHFYPYFSKVSDAELMERICEILKEESNDSTERV